MSADLWTVIADGRLACKRCGGVACNPGDFYRGHIAARKPECLRPWSVLTVSEILGIDTLQVAWDDLFRAAAPDGAEVLGLNEPWTRIAVPTEDERAYWYQRGFEAQQADTESMLSRYPAHWELEDQANERHGANHDQRVVSWDALREAEGYIEDGYDAPWTEEDADDYDDPDSFVDAVSEVARLTRREREVARWIADGNAVAGVDYAERLAEALDVTVPAAKMALSRLRNKLRADWVAA